MKEFTGSKVVNGSLQSEGKVKGESEILERISEFS